MRIEYRRRKVDDVDVFYREAGRPGAPAILLLHGFPTSSQMFASLIPLLAKNFRVIAPDLPGFGETRAPRRGVYDYTFDRLAETIEGFVDEIGLERYALYLFDYGAPVGFRLAMVHPDRVSAIVSQNGNAYEEGFSDGWGAWFTYWRDPTPEHRDACRTFLTDDSIRAQHNDGANDLLVSPDGAKLDIAYVREGEREEIQLDLILSYRTNVEKYPAFQQYFRDRRPPLLATWGRHDVFFVPAGALAFMRDLPHAEVHLLDTGHFALETHVTEIAALIERFLISLERAASDGNPPQLASAHHARKDGGS